MGVCTVAVCLVFTLALGSCHPHQPKNEDLVTKVEQILDRFAVQQNKIADMLTRMAKAQTVAVNSIYNGLERLIEPGDLALDPPDYEYDDPAAALEPDDTGYSGYPPRSDHHRRYPQEDRPRRFQKKRHSQTHVPRDRVKHTYPTRRSRRREQGNRRYRKDEAMDVPHSTYPRRADMAAHMANEERMDVPHRTHPRKAELAPPAGTKEPMDVPRRTHAREQTLATDPVNVHRTHPRKGELAPQAGKEEPKATPGHTQAGKAELTSTTTGKDEAVTVHHPRRVDPATPAGRADVAGAHPRGHAKAVDLKPSGKEDPVHHGGKDVPEKQLVVG